MSRTIVTNSGSKEQQDKFVLKFIPQGFFLDLGSQHPEQYNNTFLLEQKNWNGILIEKDEKYLEYTKEIRKSPIYCIDCDNINWLEFLQKNNVPKVIDYISADLDDSNINFIETFPFDQYEFKIMTFETDLYKTTARKTAAMQVLSKHNQYKMVLENGQLFDGRVWEDWWVNEKFIDCKDFYSNNIRWSDFVDRLYKKNMLL